MIQIFDKATADYTVSNLNGVILAEGTLANCDPVGGFIHIREQLLEAIGRNLSAGDEITDAQLRTAANELLRPFFDHKDGEKFDVSFYVVGF